MNTIGQRDIQFGFVNRTQLTELKLKALRAGVWFKVLQRIDRALIDLALKVNSVVRSFTLAKRILAVAKKFEEALQNKLARTAVAIGVTLARKLSEIAQGWGNETAKVWATDLDFVRYLGLTRLNG